MRIARDVLAAIVNYPLIPTVDQTPCATLSRRVPRLHHRHLKSTNMLERLNEELRRRTRVVRIFPSAASCLRLTRALCAETHEASLEDNCYINMDLLREQRKEQLRKAAQISDRDRQFAQLNVHDPIRGGPSQLDGWCALCSGRLSREGGRL